MITVAGTLLSKLRAAAETASCKASNLGIEEVTMVLELRPRRTLLQLGESNRRDTNE